MATRKILVQFAYLLVFLQSVARLHHCPLVLVKVQLPELEVALKNNLFSQMFRTFTSCTREYSLEFLHHVLFLLLNASTG
jgi:hypothetical protein